jgi:hypothetical protein
MSISTIADANKLVRELQRVWLTMEELIVDSDDDVLDDSSRETIWGWREVCFDMVCGARKLANRLMDEADERGAAMAPTIGANGFM